jgi:hypothetical protein
VSIEFATLSKPQLYRAQRHLAGSFWFDDHFLFSGTFLQLLLQGDQTIIPLALELSTDVDEAGTAALIVVVGKRSFPDLMVTTLATIDDAITSRRAHIEGLGVRVAEQDGRALARRASGLTTVAPPPPHPEPLGVPGGAGVRLSVREAFQGMLEPGHKEPPTGVFEGHIPEQFALDLAALLDVVMRQLRDESDVRKWRACQSWCQRLRDPDTWAPTSTDEAPVLHGGGPLIGTRPDVNSASEFRHHLAFKDGALSYDLGEERRTIHLDTGLVTTPAGALSDAPMFKLGLLYQTFPLLPRYLSQGAQLPLGLTANDHEALDHAWACHWDGVMRRVMAKLEARPAVIQAAHLAPSWPSAPMLQLAAANPQVFEELLEVAPCALFLMQADVNAVHARYPIHAALTAVGLPATRPFQRWLKRLDPALMGPGLVTRFKAALADDRKRVSLWTTHGLMSSRSCVEVILEPTIRPYLRACDLEMMAEDDARRPGGRPHVFRYLKSLVRTTTRFGLRDPLKGRVEAAKVAAATGHARTPVDAYVGRIEEAARALTSLESEATTLALIGVERVALDDATLRRFEVTNERIDARALGDHRAIRGYGLAGARNCLAYSASVLESALRGLEILVAIEPPKTRRFSRVTLSLSPVFPEDHEGAWVVREAQAARGQSLTEAAKGAITTYCEAMSSRGVQIVTQRQAHQLRVAERSQTPNP